ncbi:MAG: hypothetical protein H6Q75_1486 [Firmicutes bacterium]|nr:hypothetical protein [Bacillota bacterium]
MTTKLPGEKLSELSKRARSVRMNIVKMITEAIYRRRTFWLPCILRK